MELKEKLKKARDEKKLSQQALADAIFVSRSAVAKWEAGLGVPCAESMEALEKFFGVEKGYFLTDKPDEVIVKKNKRVRKTSVICGVMTGVAVAALLVVVFVYDIIGFNKGAIVERLYSYNKEITSPSGEIFVDPCSLYLHTDGTFFYMPGYLSSFVMDGEWKRENDAIILTDTTRSENYVLQIKGNSLVYDEASSDRPLYGVKDGTTFAFIKNIRENE